MTRKRAPSEPDEPEAKDRVIHTRVPESLEAELRERAAELGMSVSNLVRNVLGHAFGLVGDVVADSQAIARAARGERKGYDVAAAAAGSASTSARPGAPNASSGPGTPSGPAPAGWGTPSGSAPAGWGTPSGPAAGWGTPSGPAPAGWGTPSGPAPAGWGTPNGPVPSGFPAPGVLASLDDVLGWQPIVLGKNAVCARCNAILPRGDEAAVGAGTQLVVCPPCLKELTA